MFFYFKLGLRNLMRNKRRALIAGSAIGIGLAALILSDALIEGMEDNLVASATDSFLGEAQIHRDGYRKLPDAGMTIQNSSSLLRELSRDPRIAAYSPRVLSQAMISSPKNLAPVRLVGVDAELEKSLSEFDEGLTEGEFLGGDGRRQLILGKKLAEILEVEIGSRVVLTCSQVGGGDLSQEMMRVSGIYHLGVAELDRGIVLVRLHRAQQLLGIGGEIHEIALKLTEPGLARRAEAPLWTEYSEGANEAVGWPLLLPQLAAALELSQFSLFLVGLILFAVVALGIINTLFMSLHERLFEFGVLRAVGTRPLQMALLILVEAFSLGVLSVLLGSFLGLITLLILSQTGIDYTGIEAMGVTFRELLYPVIRFQQFYFYPLVLLALTVTVGLYPAWHAARMEPVDALRRSF